MWLVQDGPDAVKHREWIHPIMTFVIHYSVVVATVPLAHDFLVKTISVYAEDSDFLVCSVSTEMIRRRQTVAVFLACYFFLYFCVRLAARWHEKSYLLFSEFYGITFMCSVTIFMSAISLYFGRPVIAQAFCVAVGIDQILWYFDIVGHILFGKFPIGVCTYLFKPGSSWISRVTSTHHLWTIPLVLWISGGAFHWSALPLSFYIVPINALMSHLLTPISIRPPRKNGKEVQYLNINLSHEMWADVKLGMFRIGEHKLPYILRLICWWYILCTVTFFILHAISWFTASGAHPSIC